VSETFATHCGGWIGLCNVVGAQGCVATSRVCECIHKIERTGRIDVACGHESASGRVHEGNLVPSFASSATHTRAHTRQWHIHLTRALVVRSGGGEPRGLNVATDGKPSARKLTCMPHSEHQRSECT
jgi:hypothetical protein